MYNAPSVNLGQAAGEFIKLIRMRKLRERYGKCPRCLISRLSTAVDYALGCGIQHVTTQFNNYPV